MEERDRYGDKLRAVEKAREDLVGSGARPRAGGQTAL